MFFKSIFNTQNFGRSAAETATNFRKKFGAGNGIQTRDLRLGKATLYQLSYSRN